MKVLTKISAIFAFALFTANISLNVLADGHEKCKNSKWGAGDELGGANYLSEKRTKLAAKLIKKGKSYPLGITINSKTPAFPPRFLSLTVIV